MSFYSEKGWWASRTVWAGLIGTAFAVASFFGAVPAGLDQTMVLEAVLAVTGVAAAIFRVKATQTVVLKPETV
jgi:hypothetical protein